MCDASNYAVGVVLGQRVDKKLNVIQYASKTLDSAQRNYATTEKEFFAHKILMHRKWVRLKCASHILHDALFVFQFLSFM